MTITPSQLRQVAPKVLLQTANDLKGSADAQTKAGTDYQTQVVVPVCTGAIWSGDSAQPEASVVVQATELAFDTASAEMLAVTAAVAALAEELDAAKQAADHVIAQAQVYGFEVDMTTGVVKYSPPPGVQPPGDGGSGDGGHDQMVGMANECTNYLQCAMRRADNADTQCGQLLTRVGEATLPLSAHADPGLLELARGANDDAYEHLGLAIMLLPQLRLQAQQDFEKVAGTDYTPLEALRSFLMGLVAFDPNDALNGHPAEFLGLLVGLFIPVDRVVEFLGQGIKGIMGLGRAAKEAEEVGEVGRVGRAPVAGQPWRGSGKTTQELIDAGMAKSKGGVPRSVRELEKHKGGKFPEPKGGPAQKLATAQGQLADIVTNPGTREVPITNARFKGGHVYIAPDGRGAAFDAEGNFVYFGEYTYPG